MRRIGTLLIAASLGCVLSACSHTEERRPKKTLPGQGEVSTLGWGRAQPGDAQPGVAGFPQTR